MAKYLLLLVLIFSQLAAFARDYCAELMIQNTTILVKNGKLFKTNYFELKINNRAGEKYGKIAIAYSKMNKITHLEAFIKDDKGNVSHKLKKSEIVRRSSIADFSLYEDDFVMEFTIRHNNYPYTIVYSYEEKIDEFLYIDYWIPVFDEEIPTRNAQLKVSVDKGYKIKYQNQLVDSPKISTTEEQIEFLWKAQYTEVLKSEPYAPPLENFMPKVVVLPETFFYETEGSFKSWHSYGRWNSELMNDANDLPMYEKEVVAKLVRNITSPEEKIKTLYHYLQDNTRYINVSIETGGLKAYPASYVSQNKYGDCKALTNYFKSVLEEVGIRGYYTTVYAGDQIMEIDRSFPSQQFNHVILFIPLDHDTIWLDCTSKGAFNYLGTFTQNRYALLTDKNSSRLVKTPPLTPADVRDFRKIKVSSQLHNVAIVFQNSYKGELYEGLLSLEKNYSQIEKDQIVRKHFVSNGIEINNYEIAPHDRDSVRIEIAINATSKSIFKHYGNDILIGNLSFDLPPITPPVDRMLPIQIDYPICKMDSICFEIPNNVQLIVEKIRPMRLQPGLGPINSTWFKGLILSM
ncbi:MAG: DUF3857 domain-containing transglutaminase family protein [Prolixibacteraceae bacterium]